VGTVTAPTSSTRIIESGNMECALGVRPFGSLDRFVRGNLTDQPQTTKLQRYWRLADLAVVGNKSILIVEDDPMNVQLVRALLAGEGYDLRSAHNADEAMDALETFQPGLILMDIQLPGKSGLELTRQLRASPAMKGASIVALSGYTGPQDEQSCLSAGWDGYIGKPIDTSTFPATIRFFLEKTPRTVSQTQSDVRDLLLDIRSNFIAESLAELDGLLSPECRADKSHLLRALHRWAGIAGTLGMPNVTEQARKTEVFIGSTEEMDVPAVREALEGLKRLVLAAAAAPAFELALPSEIVRRLSEKRVGLAGFSQPEANRIAKALDGAECFTLCIETPPEGLSSAMIEQFDIVILNVGGAAGATCQRNTSPGVDKPILLVGSRANIADKLLSIETPARDFLMTPWDSEELLVRCCKLLRSDSGNTARRRREGPAQVVIADDDPAIGALLTATLRRVGAECHLARSGIEALALVRQVLPDALILDVNMPGIDGFEVLTSLRADVLTTDIPIVLLTARHQEADVLKGFSRGASDYITKPFNPLEVTARLAQYLPRKKA
jgi:DNA-binding response OmpR family regulator